MQRCEKSRKIRFIWPQGGVGSCCTRVHLIFIYLPNQLGNFQWGQIQSILDQLKKLCKYQHKILALSQLSSSHFVWTCESCLLAQASQLKFNLLTECMWNSFVRHVTVVLPTPSPRTVPASGQDLPVVWTRSSKRASGNVDTTMAIKCRWSLGLLLLEIADGREVPRPTPPPPPPLSPALLDGIECVKFCGFRRMFA